MEILGLVVVTGLIFLIGDAIMLPKVVKPLFERHLGSAVLSSPRKLPAVLFYLLYVGGLVWFGGFPALVIEEPMVGLINGAVLGLFAYGTYELVSWTVMRDWHPSMVAVDMIWGMVLSAVATWGSVTAMLFLRQF